MQIIFLGVLIGLNVLFSNCDAVENADKSGVYQVQKSYLNLKNCNVTGKVVDYASKYLKISEIKSTENQYKIHTCDGESLDELSCSGRFNASTLTQNTDGSFEGYRFGARKSFAKDGTQQCLLTALRRKIIPLKGEYIRYERADWGSTLADYSYECTRETAHEFFEAQSLKCSSLIVIDAVRVVAPD